MSERTCSHPDDCPEPHEALGWCRLHYRRVQATGDPGPLGRLLIVGDDRARFESKVDRSGGRALCHPWTGPVDPCGYARFGIAGTVRLAHTVAWEWHAGMPIPTGREIDHECHNEAVRQGACRPGICAHRRCCNPLHLVARSRQEHRDVTLRIDVPHGSDNHAAKLTEADIPLIRAALSAGESQASIGRRFGVSQVAIGHIRRGITWRHVA